MFVLFGHAEQFFFKSISIFNFIRKTALVTKINLYAPLYGGPELFGGGGKPPALGCGPGPGVEEPLGAGEAVY